MLTLYRNFGLAALASLATIASASPGALADKPVDQVNVVNPAANPLPTRSVDDPGRIPYQESQFCLAMAATCTFNFSPVPQGYRLVVQHISGDLRLANANASGVAVQLSGGILGHSSFIGPPSLLGETLFDQRVLYYIDAGSTPTLNILVDARLDQTIQQEATLFGYLLDCTASPCAPIAP